MAVSVLDRFLPKLLLAISIFLLCWGLLGLVEYVFPTLNMGLQNSRFPDGLQFAHFFAIILTGAVFVVGYLRKWPYTPFATITMYAVLATLCFVEVMDFGAFGGGTMGVLTMLLEYAMYVGLSTYLLRSKAMRRHFGNALYAN
tara:strand:+ start:138 stop:566 length:429 start_codon:yes stop_codon:yes gene_type:complete